MKVMEKVNLLRNLDTEKLSDLREKGEKEMRIISSSPAECDRGDHFISGCCTRLVL